jgi:hypothetical protein
MATPLLAAIGIQTLRQEQKADTHRPCQRGHRVGAHRVDARNSPSAASGKEALRYRVRAVREFIESVGIKP